MSGEEGPRVLTQESIDALKAPAEGFWVFNATTGCINYFLNRRWHELCGSCLPKPGRVEKVSVKYRNNNYILFPTVAGKVDNILLIGGSETLEKSFQSGDSLVVPAIHSSSSDSFEIRLGARTECGQGIPYVLRLKNRFSLRFGPVQTDSVTGLRYRKAGALEWLVEDYLPSQAFPHPVPERPDVIIMKKAQDPCPGGWRLPAPEDWEALLSPFGDNLKPLFEPAQNQNLGLGLSLSNMYSAEERKILGEGSAGLYHTSKRAGNQETFASPRPSGFLIVSEKAEKAGAGVRCVR